MMALVKKLFYICLFLFTFLMFLPKENLYYFVLDKLTKHEVSVLSKSIENHIIGLNLDKNELRYKSMNMAKIDNFEIQTVFFYTSIKIKKIDVSSDFQKLLFAHLPYINITHSLLKPLEINFEVPKGFFLNEEISKYLIKTDTGYKYEIHF